MLTVQVSKGLTFLLASFINRVPPSCQGALVESDSHCDELEAKTKLLEGQVMDLQEQLTQHTVADEQVVNLVHSRAQEWEVRMHGQALKLNSLYFFGVGGGGGGGGLYA